MTLQRVLKVLWMRRAFVIAVVVTVVGIAVIGSALAPRKYVAELTLVVDIKGSDPLADTNLSSPLLSTYIATQREIIASRNVALKVIDAVGPSGYADRDNATSDPQDDPRAGHVASVLRSLDTTSGVNSNIIKISYQSTDPDTAAQFANAFGAAYIQTSLELQVDPARRQAAWFEQQVQELRQKLANAQSRLDIYQRDYGVLGVDEGRLDVENARLQEISSQLVKAQAAMYDAETRSSQVRGVSAGSQSDLPDLLNNSLLQSLKSELARSEAKLAELSERVDRNHPHFRSASAEVGTIRARLNAEIGVAKASLAQSADLMRQQVREVQSALNEQKERIISLRQQRDELAVLQRDVESARAAYDAALEQANRTRLQSRIERTNIAVLNPAIPPASAASPRLLLNVVLAFIVGGLLAAGWISYREFLTPRLRNNSDLDELGDFPVLADLPALPAPPRRRLARSRQPLLQPQMRPRLT